MIVAGHRQARPVSSGTPFNPLAPTTDPLRATVVHYHFDAPLAAIGTCVETAPVRQRLRSNTLLAFYDAWFSISGPGGQAPAFDRFDPAQFSACGGLTVAEVDGNGKVHFVEVGRNLIERQDGSIDKSTRAGQAEHVTEDAYARCGRSKSATYERLKFDFGDNTAATFERLLVPFASGQRITHVAGMVVLTGKTHDAR